MSVVSLKWSYLRRTHHTPYTSLKDLRLDIPAQHLQDDRIRFFFTVHIANVINSTLIYAGECHRSFQEINSLSRERYCISDAIKKEYAAATGADVDRLLSDCAYKEKHRSALSTYFRDQIRKHSRLPEAHFLDVMHAAVDMDVLFVTGMRDEAPVAAFSHLVPDSRLLEVRVNASMSTQEARRGCQGCDGHTDDHKNSIGSPCPMFNNDRTGPEAAKTFCKDYLLPFFHEDMERLASMVRSVPDFPRPGVEFRHVLDISQQVVGLALCTPLLQEHFIGAWTNVTVVVCCEVGGFVYASALAARVGLPLALIREAGKLPPPTISVMKPPSHISSATSNDLSGKRIEMGRDVIPRGASVLVVDDVLATGETLCAVLRLLGEAGVGAEDVNVMVVAEFPLHRGRELLHCRGFGRARIQSLLVASAIETLELTSQATSTTGGSNAPSFSDSETSADELSLGHGPSDKRSKGPGGMLSTRARRLRQESQDGRKRTRSAST